MNRADAIVLAQLVRAARPQQTWNEHTPDAWALSLQDISCEDARAVLPDLFANAAWVTPVEIRAAVKGLRDRRLDTYSHRIPPPPDPDDVAGAIAWVKEWRRAVADGQVPPEPEALTPGQMPPLAQLLPAMPAAPSGRRAVSHANPALSRACPWCKAPVGKRCTNGAQSVAWVHDARSGSTPAAQSPSQEQHT